MYCSRVTAPPLDGVGAGEAIVVEFSTAAVCKLVCAAAAPGSSENPRRAAMMVERICHHFTLIPIILYHKSREKKRETHGAHRGLHSVHVASAKTPGLESCFPRKPAPQQSTVFATQPSSTDRKSTRLNSSHLVISYAVFC